MSFNPFHSLQELHIKYDHLWSFVHKILEILKEMEARHIVDKEMNERKILKKCKFFNRGFCREGKSCHYLHPEKNCREHCEGKSCPEGYKCQWRHPYYCQHWQKGNCFHGVDCLYLHGDKPEDKEREYNDNEETHEEISEETSEETSDETSDETIDETSDETIDKPLSTEEIIKLYENRTDLDVNMDEQLSVEEIIKIIENDEDVEAFADVNDDDSCTEDLILLYKHKMSNKNKRNEIESGLRKSTRKGSKSKRI